MHYNTLVVFVLGLAVSAKAEYSKGIRIVNRGVENLWIEMTDEEGFYLPRGQTGAVVLDGNWEGSIRAFPEDCGTNTCNLPYSEAVLKFDEEGEDRYYVSLLEGFSSPLKIQTISADAFCKPLSCIGDIKKYCPKTHQIFDSKSKIIACKSSPEIFEKLCPLAVNTEEDIKTKYTACKASIYQVVFG